MKRTAVFSLVVLLVAGALAMPIDLTELANNLQAHLNVPQPISPQSFSWSNCGPTTDSIFLNALSISPDPIKLGNNVTVAVDLNIREALTSTSFASVSLKLSKKVFGFWVQIPCENQVGSCTYKGLCDIIGNAGPTICPILRPYGVPCSCPFPANDIKFGPVGIPTKNPGQSWLTSGDYQAQAIFNKADGSQLGCLQVQISLA